MSKQRLSLYHVGGCLPLESQGYVFRQADKELYENIKLGEFCYILNSRQMGKSSLKVQVVNKLQEEGYTCAAIDISAIGTSNITPEEWYAGVIYRIVDELKLENRFDLDEWWNRKRLLSVVQRFTLFIEEIVLSNIATPISIFIDEIDSVLSLPFQADNFFAAIRACYNLRAERPRYKHLTFIIIGAATPSELIQDRAHTPFNIGKAISLSGFSLEESQSLANGFAGIAENPFAVLQEVLFWTNGQPFLTQKICRMIEALSSPILIHSEKDLVSNLVKQKVIENWEVHDEPEHFKTIRDRLLWRGIRSIRLLDLYSRVLQDPIAIDDSRDQVELRLSGLVIGKGSELVVNNRIYAEIFNKNWIEFTLRNLRPYADLMESWRLSGMQDDNLLLKGEELQKTLIWSKDKNIGSDDFQFITASLRASTFQIATPENTLRLTNEEIDLLDQLNQEISQDQLSTKNINIFEPLEIEIFHIDKHNSEKTQIYSEINQYLMRGLVDLAVQKYLDAQAKNIKLDLPPTTVNNLRWYGTLLGYVNKALSLGDTSILISTEIKDDTYYSAIDGRGLTRLMSGDVDGAIDDFRIYSTATGDQERHKWISNLLRGLIGIDPLKGFTPENLLKADLEKHQADLFEALFDEDPKVKESASNLLNLIGVVNFDDEENSDTFSSQEIIFSNSQTPTFNVQHQTILQDFPDNGNSSNSSYIDLSSDLEKESLSFESNLYSRLKNLLSISKWKDADRETETIILEHVRQGDWLDRNDILNFPCSILGLFWV